MVVAQLLWLIVFLMMELGGGGGGDGGGGDAGGGDAGASRSRSRSPSRSGGGAGGVGYARRRRRVDMMAPEWRGVVPRCLQRNRYGRQRPLDEDGVEILSTDSGSPPPARSRSPVGVGIANLDPTSPGVCVRPQLLNFMSLTI